MGLLLCSGQHKVLYGHRGILTMRYKSNSTLLFLFRNNNLQPRPCSLNSDRLITLYQLCKPERSYPTAPGLQLIKPNHQPTLRQQCQATPTAPAPAMPQKTMVAATTTAMSTAVEATAAPAATLRIQAHGSRPFGTAAGLRARRWPPGTRTNGRYARAGILFASTVMSGR